MPIEQSSRCAPSSQAIDIQNFETLTEEQRHLLTKYGRLPSIPMRESLAQKLQDRKYFDSGDYALSKLAGSGANAVIVGALHPSPDRIPRSSSANSLNGGSSSSRATSTSPMKEATSFTATDDEVEEGEGSKKRDVKTPTTLSSSTTSK